jgi:hypothetical protein
VLAPLATVTEVGADTVAADELHPTDTATPPDGAGPESDTVH